MHARGAHRGRAAQGQRPAVGGVPGYFDLDNYPTLAIGVGAKFRQADEGWGPRELPDLDGDVRWGLHLTEELVNREFDLTVSQDLAIDHGIFSWLPYVFRRRADGWPVSIANEDLDRYFLRRLPDHLDELVQIPVREYMRLGGTEAAELTLWFAMRAALSPRATPAYTFQAFPAITGCGALVMTEPGALKADDEVSG